DGRSLHARSPPGPASRRAWVDRLSGAGTARDGREEGDRWSRLGRSPAILRDESPGVKAARSRAAEQRRGLLHPRPGYDRAETARWGPTPAARGQSHAAHRIGGTLGGAVGSDTASRAAPAVSSSPVFTARSPSETMPTSRLSRSSTGSR